MESKSLLIQCYRMSKQKLYIIYQYNVAVYMHQMNFLDLCSFPLEMQSRDLGGQLVTKLSSEESFHVNLSTIW